MAGGGPTLPHRTDRTFLSDGGLETWLMFLRSIDLPAFASFPLLRNAEGRAQLESYFLPFLELAKSHGTGYVFDTPTWRANPDWGRRLGYTQHDLDAINRKAAIWANQLRAAHATEATPIVVAGVIGPRGDGYKAGARMTAEEAAAYHTPQIRAFAEGGADMVGFMTVTYAEEAIGVARAAAALEMPSAISFTVETDGRLPSGQALGDAVQAVDTATGAAPAYYMVNCAYPTHFAGVLAPDLPWCARVRGIRANASRRSHAELDAATELDIGDPVDLARHYRALRARLPQLSILGGCCGTDHRHVAAICEACVSV